MFKKMKLIVTVFVLLAMVGGCSASGGEVKAEDNVGGEAAPVNKDIVVILSSISNTLDVAVAYSTNTTSIGNTFYDTLMTVDDAFNLVPSVATEVNQTNEVTYELTIAEGYVFHNDEKVTMEDIVYSVLRMKEIPQIASVVNNVKSVEASGEHKIIITLNEPNVGSMRDILLQTAIVNKAYVTADPEKSGLAPIGTGPFVVTEFIPGSKVVVEKWVDYPFEKPETESVTFKMIEEKSGRYMSVETAEADVAMAIAFEDVERAKGNDELNLSEVSTTNTHFISMNCTKAPFDNVNVRRAMAFATNKEAFAMINGGSETIQSMTPSMLSSYATSDEAIVYNLESAKELMAEEGYTPESPLEFEMWTYGAPDPIVQAYQAELRSIGAVMTIKNLEFGVFLEGMINQEYEMLKGSWNNTTGNPILAFENYCSASYGVQNISYYVNEKADELYNKAKLSKTDADLASIAQEMENLVAFDTPIIPTISAKEFSAYNSSIKNIRFGTNGQLYLRHVTFE